MMNDEDKKPQVCSDHHLTYLMAAAMSLAESNSPRRCPDFWWKTVLMEDVVLSPESIQWTGQMLRDQNEESVRDWTGDPLPEYTPFRVTGYTLRERAEFPPVEVIRAARHYADQSMYAPGWCRSKSACFIDELIDVAIARIPGYASASPDGPAAMHIFEDIELAEDDS